MKIIGGVICLPYGLSHVPQQLLPALEKWPKFTLWVGADGVEHIRNLARKLGESRCLIVRFGFQYSCFFLYDKKTC